MIRIAICDDDESVCEKIESLILAYAERMSIRVETYVFYLALNLLDNIKNQGSYDLIFLDIEMNKMNGIEFGTILRNELNDDETRIVYVSWTKNYAMNLFKIRPYDYLIKPVEDHKQEIEQMIEKVNQDVAANQMYYLYNLGKSFEKVKFSDIYFFQSENRVVSIHLKDSIIRIYQKLDAIETSIKHNNFLRIHKSYLINTNKVKKYEPKEVTMDNGIKLSISITYRTAVTEYYTKKWRMR